jgi:hypothetical protein
LGTNAGQYPRDVPSLAKIGQCQRAWIITTL